MKLLYNEEGADKDIKRFSINTRTSSIVFTVKSLVKSFKHVQTRELNKVH